MDGVSSSTREEVFRRIANRESDYYKHNGIWWWESWDVVPKGTEGGYFKGTVLSEADINFTTKMYFVSDIFTVLDYVAKAGAVVIIVIIAVKASPIILANLKAIISSCSLFGIKNGLSMYLTFGANGILSFVELDLSDGDSSVDDIALQLAKVLQKDLSDGDSVLDDIGAQAKNVNDIANRVALKATHGNYDTVVLGRYKFDGISYVEVAIKNKSTYYQLNNRVWEYLSTKYGENFIWLVNQRFLEQQAAKGVVFNYSHDIVTQLGGYFTNEINFIEKYYNSLLGVLVK